MNQTFTAISGGLQDPCQTPKNFSNLCQFDNFKPGKYHGSHDWLLSAQLVDIRLLSA
jgi:hypothetical protein